MMIQKRRKISVLLSKSKINPSIPILVLVVYVILGSNPLKTSRFIVRARRDLEYSSDRGYFI